MQSRPVPLDIPVPACTIPVARVSLGSAVAACNIRHAKDCSPHVPALVPHLGNYGIRCDHMLAKSPTLLMLQTLTCQPRRTKNHKIPPLQLTGTSPSTVLLLSAVFWQDQALRAPDRPVRRYHRRIRQGVQRDHRTCKPASALGQD